MNLVLQCYLLILIAEANLCLLGQSPRLNAVGLADLRRALSLAHGLARYQYHLRDWDCFLHRAFLLLAWLHAGVLDQPLDTLRLSGKLSKVPRVLSLPLHRPRVTRPVQDYLELLG